MVTFQRLPWVSLTLVFLTYCCLGWVLADVSPPLYIWGLVAIAILVLLEFLTIPWKRLSHYFSIFLKSALRSFLMSLFGAFCLFIFIVRFRLFLDATVILCATILARIDFQNAQFSRTQMFWTLAFVSMFGLFAGFMLEQVV